MNYKKAIAQEIRTRLSAGYEKRQIVDFLTSDAGMAERTAYRKVNKEIEKQKALTGEQKNPEARQEKIDPDIMTDPDIQKLIEKKRKEKQKKIEQQRKEEAARKAKPETETEAGINIPGYYSRTLSMFIPDGDPADISLYKFPDNYIKRSEVFQYIEAGHKTGTGLKLSGPAGSGKTSIILKYAQENSIPCIKITCNPSEPLEKITYSRTAITDSAGKLQIVYIAGKLIQAILLHEELIILLDEINKTPPEKSSIISQLADSTSPGISTPGKYIPLKPRQVVFGTMNEGNEYSSRFNESREIADRIPKIDIPALSLDEKIKMIHPPAGLKKQLHALLKTLDSWAESNNTENPVSLRGAMQAIKLIKAGMDWETSWTMIIRKHHHPDDSSFKSLKQIIEVSIEEK